MRRYSFLKSNSNSNLNPLKFKQKEVQLLRSLPWTVPSLVWEPLCFNSPHIFPPPSGLNLTLSEIRKGWGVNQERGRTEEKEWFQSCYHLPSDSWATGTHLQLHDTVEVDPQHFFDWRNDILLHSSSGQHYKLKPTTKCILVLLRIMKVSHFRT
jgi:hypothetical protein